MSTVSVREFSYNPSAIFSRVEDGETIEVTRHGTVIALLIPGTDMHRRYARLLAKGNIRLKATTTKDLDKLPHIDVPDDVDPLAMLLAEREADDR